MHVNAFGDFGEIFDGAMLHLDSDTGEDDMIGSPTFGGILLPTTLSSPMKIEPLKVTPVTSSPWKRMSFGDTTAANDIGHPNDAQIKEMLATLGVTSQLAEGHDLYHGIDLVWDEQRVEHVSDISSGMVSESDIIADSEEVVVYNSSDAAVKEQDHGDFTEG